MQTYFRKSPLLVAILTGLLVYAIAEAPAFQFTPAQAAAAQQAHGAKPAPQIVEYIICGVIILLIGVIIVIQLNKLCKKLIHKDDPPATNAPVVPDQPVLGPPIYTNPGLASLNLKIQTGDAGDQGVGYRNVRGLAGQRAFDCILGTEFQASTDASNWITQGFLFGWYTTNAADNNLFTALYDASMRCVQTNYGGFDSGMSLAYPLLTHLPATNCFFRLRAPDCLR